MKKYNIVIISIVVLIISGFSFYWFAYRPTQIKKESVQEIRIIPQQKATFFKMEVVYEIEEQDLNLNQRQENPGSQMI